MASNLTDAQIQDRLNRCMPAARDAHLGDLIYALLNAYNGLQAKYQALLAHLDTANVTGIGNANVATYGDATVLTLPAEL